MIFECDTEFNHYQVEDTIYNGRPARVLYSGHKIAAQSGVSRDDQSEMLFDYNQRFLELVRGIRPTRILILGGGAFTLPAALIREFSDMLIDVVEIDRMLVNIAKEYFDFQPNANTNVHINDARKFLDSTSQKYDMILVDVFINAEIPSAFRATEFAQSLQRHLSKHAVTAINIIASLQGSNSAHLHRMHENLQATFPAVQIFPADRNLSPWISQNYIMTAQAGTRDVTLHLSHPPIDLTEYKL